MSMLAGTKTKTIAGNVYTVVPFPAMKAIALQNKLFKMIVPPLAQAIGGITSFSSLRAAVSSNLDGTALAGAVQSLLSNLDEEAFFSLLRELFANITVAVASDGKARTLVFTTEQFESTFNALFQCSLVNVYTLAFFVLEVNYPDFFDLISNRLGSLMKKTDGLSGQTGNETND